METGAKRPLLSFRTIWLGMMLTILALQIWLLNQTHQMSSSPQALLRVNMPKFRSTTETEGGALVPTSSHDALDTDSNEQLSTSEATAPLSTDAAPLDGAHNDEDILSAMDLVLKYKYNETCVELRDHHLEALFIKPDLCLSRRRMQQILIDLVLTTSAVFTQHNITHFLDSGTLLGAHRHKSVIPYDVDSDMAINAAGYETIKHTPIQFPPEYYMQVFDSTVHPTGTRYIELPVRVTHRESALYLDVFVYNDSVDENGSEWTGPLPAGCFINCAKCPRLEETRWELKLPRNWIYPLQDCRFAKHTLKCPAETEQYLEYMFGDNYMEPIRYI